MSYTVLDDNESIKNVKELKASIYMKGLNIIN